MFVSRGSQQTDACHMGHCRPLAIRAHADTEPWRDAMLQCARLVTEQHTIETAIKENAQEIIGAQHHGCRLEEQIQRIETNIDCIQGQLRSEALRPGFTRELEGWQRRLSTQLHAALVERNAVRQRLFDLENRCLVLSGAHWRTIRETEARRDSLEAHVGISLERLRHLVEHVEAPLRARLHDVEERQQCPICCNRNFSCLTECCQHLMCTTCSSQGDRCPFCRAPRTGAFRTLELRH
jgi:hypothetical protein